MFSFLLSMDVDGRQGDRNLDGDTAIQDLELERQAQAQAHPIPALFYIDTGCTGIGSGNWHILQ